MTPEAREEVHKTTAFLLKRAQPLIQSQSDLIPVSFLKLTFRVLIENYLIQCCAIAESYAKAIYESVLSQLLAGISDLSYSRLPAHEGYTFDEIKEGSKTAHLVGKNMDMHVSAGKEGYGFLGRSVPAGGL